MVNKFHPPEIFLLKGKADPWKMQHYDRRMISAAQARKMIKYIRADLVVCPKCKGKSAGGV